MGMNNAMPTTKEEAVKMIETLKRAERECEAAGLTGAAIANEQRASAIAFLWGLK